MRAVLLLPLLLLACGPQTKPTDPPATPDASEPEPAPEEPAPTDASSDRPAMTAAECETAGGKIVGDIGDGAIHKPDYVCPESGEAPIGTIKPDAGGPVAVEGSVCCK